MSEQKRTHYPNFNVMHEEEHWDDHTREIVSNRFEIPEHFQKLTGEEVLQIKALASLFVDDNRGDVLDYVVKHFDSKFTSDIGESQRKTGVPPQKILIRDGLAALDLLAQSMHGCSFTGLSPEQQTSLLVGLENNSVELRTRDGRQLPATEFFNKMLTQTVQAYYSHPLIWSEIGYAGPAYPRGYVRSELGLTDPWEAKKDA